MPKNSETQTEPRAGWGDIAKGLALLTVVSVLSYMFIKDDRKIQATQQNRITIDSLVNDSLSKTIEYQNAERATRELEARRADIYEYFTEKVKQ